MKRRPPRTRPRFYNTIHLRGKELERASQEAETQEERILAFFLILGHGVYVTRDHVLDFMAGPPISSITRAMSNLLNAGFIVKVMPEEKAMAMGRFGKPLHWWRLPNVKLHGSDLDDQLPLPV